MLLRSIVKPLPHLRPLTSILCSRFRAEANPYLLGSLSAPSFASPYSAPSLNLSFVSLNLRLFSYKHSNTTNNNKDADVLSDNKDADAVSDVWKLSESDGVEDSIFGKDDDLAGIVEGNRGEESKTQEASWTLDTTVNDKGNIFEEAHEGFKHSGSNDSAMNEDEWATSAGYKPWTLGEEEKVVDVFDLGEMDGLSEMGDVAGDIVERQKIVEDKQLEKEEQMLKEVLKGPNRTFGDLVAASGISDAMLDSLMALKNFQDIEGLPPLAQIEEERYEKSTRKSARSEMERQKQEEVAKARVRKVDEKERAYGTGKRKCSIARVWIQPGVGKIVVNDKDFDAYFPMLDHRAALLRPFSQTNTLGHWDVKCTVKGGGVSGQVGAIQLGISRALQNWEPGLRPALREVGFLTRDPRVVERKKPGKAKARKSFQWVKR